MSYLLYINENLIELPNGAQIPQTKQVNDLARLDNRQSNFTNKFLAPFTANNIRAMEGVYLVGNNSNLPYQKNECSLFDADSGACLIYKGWAVVSKTSSKGYEINVYDGIIDFYRKIENKSLSDLGITELNHAKSISNIIASWNNNLPYMYALADYNGNNEFMPPSGVVVQVNSDYQVPSARVSFLWNKIFEFAGFTYSGTYFSTEDFTNLFMTFPKPVPIKTPILFNVTYQNSILVGDPFSTSSYNVMINETFTNSYAKFVVDDKIKIKIAGVYQLKASGSWDGNGIDGSVNFFLRRLVGWTLTIVSSGSINGNSNEVINISCNVNDDLTVVRNNFGTNGATGVVSTSLDYIVGFDANFEEALVDFSAKDFVNEIMQEAGLTAFKNKYSKHIDFLTVNEILASPTRIDWSDKFQFKETESYKIGRYAKINNFKYRYNSENETHNNGSFDIADENLDDKVDVLQSKLYTPERLKGKIYGKEVPIFKIWEKEFKDDSTVEYKDLTGRFYFLRVKSFSNTIRIASEELNTEATATNAMFANYNGLRFSELIFNNYSTISRILNKGKIIDAYFDLKPKDIETFSFKIPIYIEQLASNYLVNKILNFVKNRTTKVELLEVDYNPALDIIAFPVATYVTIDSFALDGCIVTFTYSTDAPIGTFINLTCTLNNFGIPSTTPVNPNYEFYAVVQNTGVSNTATFTLIDGAFYVLFLQIPSLSIISNQVFFENNGICAIEENPVAKRIEIVSVTAPNNLGYIVNWTLEFTTDVQFPTPIQVRSFANGVWSIWNTYTVPISDIGALSFFVQITTITSVGTVSKFQIRYGGLESNIYNL